MELLDEVLGEQCIPSEVIRCIQVGLLCVQQRPEDRPNMSSVVLMLNGDKLLPKPMFPDVIVFVHELKKMPISISYLLKQDNEKDQGDEREQLKEFNCRGHGQNGTGEEHVARMKERMRFILTLEDDVRGLRDAEIMELRGEGETIVDNGARLTSWYHNYTG
ncbi:hypothetical protein Fmac_021230 [Flemingia macrophylla]|uniref:S-locus receptor kinase C-terminal domain-containing protein n=1 Tax=Flemingia macrophylla TaxID=520843 RepID=A0ABD1LW96_9FABA